MYKWSYSWMRKNQGLDSKDHVSEMEKLFWGNISRVEKAKQKTSVLTNSSPATSSLSLTVGRVPIHLITPHRGSPWAIGTSTIEPTSKPWGISAIACASRSDKLKSPLLEKYTTLCASRKCLQLKLFNRHFYKVDKLVKRTARVDTLWMYKMDIFLQNTTAGPNGVCLKGNWLYTNNNGMLKQILRGRRV